MAAVAALIILVRRWRAGPTVPWREATLCLAALTLPLALSIIPFLLWTPGGFWRDIVLFTSGGLPDSYPISGFGLGGILVALGVLPEGGHFPFVALQLPVLVVIGWLGWRASRRSIGPSWFMTLYAAMFFAFGFLARYFSDNYAATMTSVAMCAAAIGGTPLLFRAPAVVEEDLALAGG
jgi:hypothetical protein